MLEDGGDGMEKVNSQVVQEQDFLKKAEELAAIFNERAAKYDANGDFPFENFEDLKNNGFLALTIPKEYGGQGINLVDYLKVIEQIAKGDGSTALSLGWHLGYLLEQSESRTWSEECFAKVCELVVKEKALLNAASSERATGSPSRGGVPTTTAIKVENGWRINGEKAFTSMAVALDYALVTVDVNKSGKIGLALVDTQLDGVQVKETWDSISMRGTKSDDLILQDVIVPEAAIVYVEDGTQKKLPKGWLLQIPAVYIGIASSARDYAIKFASEYKPNTLPGPIKEVPEVRRKVGEMELELFKARELLYSVARKWVEQPEERDRMGSELAAVKHIATNSANKIVDIAMRIVGSRSLSAKNPLQRYLRDVRAGLHNPPSDDMILYNLAKTVFDNETK